MRTAESKTILLVEDDRGVASVLKAVLQASGFSVLVADSARDALNIAHSGGSDIHLVVADVMLPDMTAPTLRKLFQVRSTAKWLYMSGYSRQMLHEHCGLEISDDNLLEKPFMPHVLLRKIRALLAGNSLVETPSLWS